MFKKKKHLLYKELLFPLSLDNESAWLALLLWWMSQAASRPLWLCTDTDELPTLAWTQRQHLQVLLNVCVCSPRSGFCRNEATQTDSLPKAEAKSLLTTLSYIIMSPLFCVMLFVICYLFYTAYLAVSKIESSKLTYLPCDLCVSFNCR